MLHLFFFAGFSHTHTLLCLVLACFVSFSSSVVTSQAVKPLSLYFLHTVTSVLSCLTFHLACFFYLSLDELGMCLKANINSISAKRTYGPKSLQQCYNLKKSVFLIKIMVLFLLDATVVAMFSLFPSVLWLSDRSCYKLTCHPV